VPDPYYDGKFESVFELLDEAIEDIITSLYLK
jgi:protein-tyrosine-phosphatase